MVGVERLLYLRTSSKTACWSTLTSFISNGTPRSARWALAQSHGGHPGIEKITTRLSVILAPADYYTAKDAKDAKGFYLRLSVWGSGWIRTLNNSGAVCLKRISKAVEMSWTRESGRSSGMVQWHDI